MRSNLRKNKNIAVIFPLSGDRQVLVGAFSAIITRLNRDEEGSKIGEDKICENGCIIDMRFEKPVIKPK